MKKIIYSIFACSLVANIVAANVVLSGTAQTVAENFYRQNAHVQVLNSVLAYTEKTSAGEPIYYVYNINGKEGFVIVSAEDAGSPIIGYSTEGNYVVPTAADNNLIFWMEKRTEEIIEMRTQNLHSDMRIQSEWSDYISNKPHNPQTMGTPHAALCKTAWNQSGGGAVPYNAQVPAGCPVGCVATAMAQIMRFFNFPVKGTGSSSYNAGSYGTLSANYGATTYNWTNMPLTSSTVDVAQLGSHCGISVEMNYAPGGSGAQVCGGIGPAAEYSYKTYFGYDPTLHCVAASDPNWITILETEFGAGRPVQYYGASSSGGHTWVADGNTAADLIHMNWGWGGSSNGNYSVNNLNPGGMVFNTSLGGLIGIKPLVMQNIDAGIPAIASPNGTTCNTTIAAVVTVKNCGLNALTSCTVNYNVDGGANQTFSWTGNLASLAKTSVTLPSINATAGTHTFTCYTSNPNGSTDGNPTNDQSQNFFTVTTTTGTLPVAESFESSANLPSGWSLFNPDNDEPWKVSTTVGNGSTHSMYFDNCNPPTNTTGTKDRFVLPVFNFSNATSANMTFDVAYAKLVLSGKTYGDTLAVMVSTDCGTTWSSVYLKGGTNLATAPDLTAAAPTCFTPTSSQWRNDNVSLTSLIGNANVMIAFENRSQWGEGIYVDNINLTSVVGVESIDAHNAFNIYPNPASSSVTVDGIAKSEKVHYSLCNMLGAEIKSGDIATSGNTFSGKIQVADMSTGMYFLKVTDGDTSFTKKLNKQ